MMNNDDEIEERPDTAVSSESTPSASRAQSNYSLQRTKLVIAPIKYGETRTEYLWRLLRSSIRRTIDAVTRADDTEIERSHGLHFVRHLNHEIPVKCVSLNVKRKEIISVDQKNVLRIYHSDGRLIRKFRLSVEFDQLFYCTTEDEFIGWSKWKCELHILSNKLEVLSTSMCDYLVINLTYNETTSDVFTCGRGRVTVWQFRYNRKHLMPRLECSEGIKSDLEYVLISAEQNNSSVQRLFVTSGYDVLCFNIADEGHLLSMKQDLHVRAMVAIIFIEERDVLVTAGRDGSIKVWDSRWFIVHAFVGHHDRVLSLYKHPFGPSIISTSQDRTIRVWSLEYGDVVDVIKLAEPLNHLTVTRNYEKFLAVSNKCLQLWCIKHYCDFLTYVGSPVAKIMCTSHPDHPVRATLLCKDSAVRIVAAESGHVLTSLVCDLSYKIVSCAYAIGENILFATDGSTLIRADTSLNPCKIIDQFEFKEYSINCLLIYEYVTKSQMEETPMLKSLVTKPSSDLIHLGLKGFSRTLLIAGFSTGIVAVLKWKTAEIDFSMDMHSGRPVVDMIANPSSDQMITCGVDLIIRIWRVYPYSTESLAVVRSIFCALPPVHLGIVKNFLSVAFRDEPTLTHSLMLYNLESNERFDHIPSADHGDRITAVSGCSRLKLTATASLDGTLRIWNGRNQLIRMIIIHDAVNSLYFCNDSGDLILGIGDHLYKMQHNSYLPKSLVFKMISMEFKPPISEEKDTEEIDKEQLARLPSADLVRFKRAHKAEKILINVIPDNSEVTAFHAQAVEQNKLKNEALERLEKRDLEIMQIAEGKLQRTKKLKNMSKIRQEAFDEYMKMFLKERKKGLLDDEKYQLTEEQLFGPLPSKPDPYVVESDNQGFFPSLKEAKSDPLENIYKEREETLNKLENYYRNQQPLPTSDIRVLHANHEKYQVKKLLNANLEKITLPSDRPHYGPGAIVPNSVLAKLLWPNREPKKIEREEWKPPTLSAEQLEALEKTAPPIDEDEAWNQLMEEAKKKREPTEEEIDDPFKSLKNKRKSSFMQQLTDLTKTPPKTPQPSLDVPADETQQDGDNSGAPTSKPPSRAARQAPMRNPVVAKIPSTPAKPIRIPVQVLPSVADESSQTFTERIKTPRTFSAPLNRLIETLKELQWFEDQFPLVKLEIFLEGIDEDIFPLEVLHRIDLIEDLNHRLLIIKALQEFYRSLVPDEQTREKLNEKILFLLTKYNPATATSIDIEFINAYLNFLVVINRITIDVVAELIYWYLDGGDQIRPTVKHVFDRCGLEDPLSYFYTEMDSWKLWELDPNQSRRAGIKTLAYEWLRQWTRSFRNHIEEMNMRLKSGDIHVQISKATSRALTGDIALSNRASTTGKNLTVTLDTLPRSLTKSISSIEVINYFVEITHEQISERNQAKDRSEDNTILVLPKINRQAALIRLGESNTIFHRPIRRNPLLLPHEHRFDPGELHLGRSIVYPVRKVALDPFRRQIFTEDIDYEDEPPYLLTLKLAPKYFLPILSQVTKT